MVKNIFRQDLTFSCLRKKYFCGQIYAFFRDSHYLDRNERFFVNSGNNAELGLFCGSKMFGNRSLFHYHLKKKSFWDKI